MMHHYQYNVAALRQLVSMNVLLLCDLNGFEPQQLLLFLFRETY